MKTFVTGGTRVLGQPVVRTLVERGHTVRALSRSAESDDLLRTLGAEPVRADLRDRVSLRAAMGDAEAVLHLATRIPPATAMRRANAWAENDQLRTQGTRTLVDVARDAGATVLLYPSITFIYPDSGAAWIDAATTTPAPVGPTRSTLDAEAAVDAFASDGGRGISLRLGNLYGPTAPHIQEALGYARRGIAAVVGRADAYHAALWVEDAASAIVAALEQAPSGIYDVVDDEPLPRQEVIAAMAEAVGRDHLWRIPSLVARAMLGPTMYDVVGRSQRVSNQRFKAATDWTPAVSNARLGWRLLGPEGKPSAIRKAAPATR